MRRRHTAEARERFLAELERSGDPVRVVAERVGVGVSTAYLWKKGTALVAPAPAPVFARLVPARPRTAKPMALVVQIGTASIRVEAGFDADLLRAVVSALGSSST